MSDTEDGMDHHEYPHDDYPCPCDGCDEWSIHPDEYCTRCIHKGCADGPGVNCNV